MTVSKEEISKCRYELGNPYAYLNDDGEFDALDRPEVSLASSAEIKGSRLNLENQYAHLNADGKFDGIKGSSGAPLLSFSKPHKARNGKIKFEDIKVLAEKVRIKLWKNRNLIFEGNPPSNPVDILDPSAVLEALSYDVEIKSSLGQFFERGKPYEVGGQIDQEQKLVDLSDQESYERQRFTLAHELGHALMHEQTGLHRDPPLDGGQYVNRDHVEKEADYFAVQFLLPEKLVVDAFKETFLTEHFVLNQENMHALNPGNDIKLQKKLSTRRGLARHLSSTTLFNGKNINSLSSRLKVSTEFLAIRLEELELV